MLPGEEGAEDALRRAQDLINHGQFEEGYRWLMIAAERGSDDREWVRTVAKEMECWNRTRVWEVWRVRCQWADAGPGDFVELARAHLYNALPTGRQPPPVTPFNCTEFNLLTGSYREAVAAMREALSRAEGTEEQAQILEELATYHAYFGRYLECQTALESVAVMRNPRNRWRFYGEHPDSADVEVP